MAHNRTHSVESISSEEAVETYREPLFQQSVTRSLKSPQPLKALIARASDIIEDFSNDDKRIFNYDKKTIKLDGILTAMLSFADEAGGERAQRYVASAIVACSDTEQTDFNKLVAVAVTWLTHLLYIFKASRSHANQLNMDPSPIATPTIEETRGFLDEGAGSRTESLRDDLLLRDGYQCIITGFKDHSHPSPEPEERRVQLRACHILRRALAVYNEDPKSNSNASAAATLDILANFTRLSGDRLEQLTTLVDDSSNGFLLESNAHDDFDQFRWCLQGTEKPDEYKIKIYDNAVTFPLWRGMWKSNTDPVVFVDQSAKFIAPANSRKRIRAISLPDPEFIRIHAAIAGILHMSGAGRFFDELLDKYRDCGGSTPLLRWEDLERVTREWEMREDVRATLSQIHVTS